jgi:peptidoglycan/LPS O-acetylase OafA/YrhL
VSTRRSTTEIVRLHMPGLDGLRGVAVLLVLAHTFDVISRASRIDDALNAGWIGVQLFFVLSGFLITGILLDTRDSPTYYRTFFTRRVLRIFPLYYTVLIIAYIVIPFDATPPPGHGAHQFWLWTYTNNYAAAFGKEEHAFPHFWSLAVEEQFYLVWPFVVHLVGRRGVTILAPIAIVAAIAARMFARQRWGEEAAYLFTPCRMDALALGALAAAMVRAPVVVFDRISPLALRIAGAIVVLGGLAVGRLDRVGVPMQYAGYTIIALGFALVLLGALDGSRLLQWRGLRRVGMYSYGMYVFHMPLHLYIGLPLIGETPSRVIAVVYVVGASAVTFGVAMASYHLFERPFLALKATLAP